MRMSMMKAANFLVFFLCWAYEALRLVVGLVVTLGWVKYHRVVLPPAPNISGCPGSSHVISPRVRLTDGRYLAYRERGVAKEEAKYKIILVHGFAGSKDNFYPGFEELAGDLRAYYLSFDRAGYGDSDPNPTRSVRSEAFDIQQLADQLELGSKFYIIGGSLGAYAVWSCLKYIPHRLAGVSLVVPAVNYFWPSFPANLSRAAYRSLLVQDQWAFRVAHYAPSLLYWWLTQKWFPTVSAYEGYRGGKEGVYESLHRDMLVLLGTWEFDPMDLKNPFPGKEGHVRIWQGREDIIVPSLYQRHVSQRLPWIGYHEVPGGHTIMDDKDLSEEMIRALLLGEESSR